MQHPPTPSREFSLRAEVWLYPGPAPWHFVTVPQALSREIKGIFGPMHRGWRSLPLDVTVGNTRWKTSMFWDTKEDAYILPLKAEVRKKENVRTGDSISMRIIIRP